MTVATLLSDFITLYLLPGRVFYNKVKFETVDDYDTRSKSKQQQQHQQQQQNVVVDVDKLKNENQHGSINSYDSDDFERQPLLGKGKEREKIVLDSVTFK